jgi:hypothetical protein
MAGADPARRLAGMAVSGTSRMNGFCVARRQDTISLLILWRGGKCDLPLQPRVLPAAPDCGLVPAKMRISK